MNLPCRVLVLVCAVLLCTEARAELRAETRVELRLQSGRVVTARLLLPVAADEPRPAVMLFGGLERGAAALDLVQPSRPTVIASFDYPFEFPESRSGSGVLRLLPATRRGIHDSLEAIGLLYAHLAAREDVDPARITIVGVSLGAPFAVLAAAEHGIPGVAVIHGFARVPEVIAHQLVTRWGEAFWVRPAARMVGALLASYADVPDIEAQAQRLRPHQRAWMLSAAADERIPPSATRALREGFQASQATFTFETEPGEHLRGEDDPRIPALLERAEQWMDRAGLR